MHLTSKSKINSNDIWTIKRIFKGIDFIVFFQQLYKEYQNNLVLLNDHLMNANTKLDNK